MFCPMRALLNAREVAPEAMTLTNFRKSLDSLSSDIARVSKIWTGSGAALVQAAAALDEVAEQSSGRTGLAPRPAGHRLEQPLLLRTEGPGQRAPPSRSLALDRARLRSAGPGLSSGKCATGEGGHPPARVPAVEATKSRSSAGVLSHSFPTLPPRRRQLPVARWWPPLVAAGGRRQDVLTLFLLSFAFGPAPSTSPAPAMTWHERRVI